MSLSSKIMEKTCSHQNYPQNSFGYHSFFPLDLFVKSWFNAEFADEEHDDELDPPPNCTSKGSSDISIILSFQRSPVTSLEILSSVEYSTSLIGTGGLLRKAGNMGSATVSANCLGPCSAPSIC